VTESHAKWFANEAMKGRMTGHFEKFMTLKKALDEAWTKERDERMNNAKFVLKGRKRSYIEMNTDLLESFESGKLHESLDPTMNADLDQWTTDRQKVARGTHNIYI